MIIQLPKAMLCKIIDFMLRPVSSNNGITLVNDILLKICQQKKHAKEKGTVLNKWVDSMLKVLPKVDNVWTPTKRSYKMKINHN